jgi:DnaJ family protein C protein 13
VESSLLKYLGAPGTDGISYHTAVARFNANVDYSGLVHAVTEDGWFKENKEKLIHSALTSLLTNGEKTDSPEHLAGEFLAIRRLVASKAGFQVGSA